MVKHFEKVATLVGKPGSAVRNAAVKRLDRKVRLVAGGLGITTGLLGLGAYKAYKHFSEKK